MHYVLDAYELVILRRLVGHMGLERDRNGDRSIEPRRGSSGEEVCWVGNSKWVTSGSADGSICIWDLSPPHGEEKIDVPNVPENLKHQQRAMTLEPAVKLQEGAGAPFRPSRAVKFNPRYCMLAMGGEDLVSLSDGLLWLSYEDRSLMSSHSGYRQKTRNRE